MIGDNTTADEQLQDEELDVLISDQGSKERAAIAAARALGARYARRADKTVGRLSISMSQISKQYFDLAKELQKTLGRLTGGASGMYAGGISVADKDTEIADTDRVAPAFTVGQWDAIDRSTE